MTGKNNECLIERLLKLTQGHVVIVSLHKYFNRAKLF
jgi:hypothetical protein